MSQSALAESDSAYLHINACATRRHIDIFTCVSKDELSDVAEVCVGSVESVYIYYYELLPY